jgi:multicomponent Na+:H+ antiporter subunit C
MAATAATLFGVGTYLVLQRKLSRVIIGLGLLTHGANVLMVTAGRRGLAPLVDPNDPSSAREFADPLPQALALTAIVISFGVTALLLALAYRSWLLSDDDEIRNIASSNEGPAVADELAATASDPDVPGIGPDDDQSHGALH